MGQYSTNQDLVCEGAGDQVTVTNQGFQNGPKVNFNGSANIPAGCAQTNAEQTFVIDGETFGPYTTLPGSIGPLTGSFAPLTFTVTGTLAQPTLLPDSGFEGFISVQSTYRVDTDNCGSDQDSATVNIVYDPPQPVLDITYNGGGEFDLDASDSSPVNCPGTVDYAWKLYAADCVTELVLGVDYTLDAGLMGTVDTGGGDPIITVTMLNPGTYCAYVQCLTECGKGDTTKNYAYNAVITAGIAINTTIGTAVQVGVDGSNDDGTDITTDSDYTYTIRAVIYDDFTGLDLGELVRFVDVGGATATPDYSSSIIAALDQGSVTVAFSGTDINVLGSGIQYNDQTIYDILNGEAPSGTCYNGGYGNNASIRWEVVEIEETTPASGRTSGNTAQALDPERCVVGFYNNMTSGEQDTQNTNKFYAVDNLGNRVVQIETSDNGCHIISTIYEVQLGLFSNRVHNLVVVPGGPNGHNEIRFAERRFDVDGTSPNREGRLMSLTHSGASCGDPLNNWTSSILHQSTTNDDLSRQFLSTIDAAVAQVNGVGIYFRESSDNSAQGLYYYDGANWQYTTLDIPAILSQPVGFTVYQMATDISTGWIYFSGKDGASGESSAWRMKLNNPGVDDPTVTGNWTFENLMTEKVSGSATGDGTVAEFGNAIHAGVFVDSTNIVNGEPVLFFSDNANHRIFKVTANTVSPSTAADWDWVQWAGSGVAGYLDGTGTAAQFNSPYCFSEQLTSSGLMLLGDEVSARVRAIDPDTGEVTTISPLPAPGAGDGTGDTLLH